MKLKAPLTVKNKMMLTYLLVGIIPLLCLTVYAFTQYAGSLKSEIMQNLKLTHQDVIRELDGKFDTYYSSMSRIVYDARVNEIFTTEDKQRQQDLITQFLTPHVNLVNSLDIALQDITIYAQGEYNSWTIESMGNIAGTELYKETMASGSAITVTDTQIIYSRCFTPLVSSKERLIVALFIDIDLFFYGMNTKENNIGILIKDTNNKYIDHKDIRTPFAMRKKELPKVTAETEDSIRVNGESFYFVGGKTRAGLWTVDTYVEKKSDLLFENMVFIFILLLLLLGCIVFLSILFSKKLVSPILSLNKKMQQVEHGDYNVQLSNPSGDEIGQLGKNFNHMVRKIQKLIEFELKQEITIRDNQLEALYAKISPHFLYNTLYTINMKSIMLDSPEISFLVTSLSSFYRTALNRGKPTISIAGELDNLRAYMNIQSVMHDDSFCIRYEIEEEILSCSIANFVLQPLAENAIEHGVDMIDEQGLIVVSGKLIGNQIYLTVEDNGPGFGAQQSAANKTGGYGIYNVEERIKLLFGSTYGLRFTKSRFGGACTELRIPKIPAEDDG